MNSFEIRLSGPGATEARIEGARLRALLDVLVESTRRAVRLMVEGRSAAPGRQPDWVTRGAEFQVVGLRAGSTVLLLEAPPFHDSIPNRLDQGALFRQLDPDEDALGLVRDALDDVVAGRADSDVLDAGLLARLADLGNVLDAQVTAISIAGGTGGSVTLREADVQRINALERRTPLSRRVMVAGKLDAIRHSDRMFTIELDSGTTLRGLADQIEPERLAEYFGRRALVSGLAVFKPSGKVLRLEADDIRAATVGDAKWSVEPTALFADIPRSALVESQGPRSGVSSLMGSWPGGESDEEIERELEDLS